MKHSYFYDNKIHTLRSEKLMYHKKKGKRRRKCLITFYKKKNNERIYPIWRERERKENDVNIFLENLCPYFVFWFIFFCFSQNINRNAKT